MIKINFNVVWHRLCKLVPLKFRNYAAEKVSKLLPRRVVGWCLFRASVDMGCNEHITLLAATTKYKNYKQNKRG